MSLFKAFATIGSLTLISRIAGFIRDILMAAMLGAGLVADAFLIALKLPNFFRRITAEGAFTVSFVPLYSEKLETKGQDDAVKMARTIMGVMLCILIIFTGMCIGGMPHIVGLLAPGFERGELRFDLAVSLAILTFPYLLLISMAALVGGILNAHNRFAAYAFVPILFNAVLVVILLMGGMTDAGDDLKQSMVIANFLAIGITLAGILQFLWVFVVAWRHGILIYPGLPRLTPEVKKLFKLMVPGIVGAGVIHLNLFADMIMASFLPVGSISHLYYADRLNQFPLGIIGIAIGTALLPMLSKAISGKRLDEANVLLNRSFLFASVLSLPAAAALAIMAEPFIRILFERGAFEAADTATTMLVLTAYAVGLPAFILGKVLQTSFFARQDTKTPVVISLVTTILNIGLSLTFIFVLKTGIAGIAVATAIAAWLQVVLLHYKGIAQTELTIKKETWVASAKTIVASLGMAIVLIGGRWIDFGLNEVLTVIATCMIAMVLYFFMVFGLNIISLEQLKQALRKTS